MKNTLCYCLIACSTLWASSSFACPECWWESPNKDQVSRENWMHGMPSMRRHHFVMRQGLPAQYQGMINPLAKSDAVLSEGKRVYQQQCASCHGESGRGDGVAGESLTPQPADLKHLMHMSWMTSDGYLYWTIAEGGKPINTDMPAFNEILSSEEAWSLVHFLKQEI